MIVTQYINSTSSRPIEICGYKTINVLKWKNSKWKSLCPYYMKTDGCERHANPGNILFENYYQGSKVYDVVYANEVYASRYHVNNPNHLWWKFNPVSKCGDALTNDTSPTLDYDLYFRWRESVWGCSQPIRYPNKKHNAGRTKFTMFIDSDGNETRMDYITARRQLYYAEYVRLAKQTAEYNELLEMLLRGETIMICEIDVPANHKRGEYGVGCDAYNVCNVDLNKLNACLVDTQEAFGHGLCLAHSLLTDIENRKLAGDI